jgi:hypothetical protein
MARRRKGDAWQHRPFHRAFSGLPAPARQRAIAGFRAGEATTGIVAALAAEHGATIAVSSLNRYREWWSTTERPVVEAAQKAEELLQQFRDHPTDELESVIRQLLKAQRLTAMTEDRKLDPMRLGILDVEERKLRLEEKKLALRERELERRVNAAAKKVEGELKRAKLDPATIDRIKREVYGLVA